MNIIPLQIITLVIKHLPLSDRKNVRLTSSLLDDCSRHVSITKREKLVFPGGGTVSCAAVGDLMIRTKSCCLNFEFRGRAEVYINSIAFEVWKQCGERVRTVRCHETRITDLGSRVLIDIFVNCRNLEVFILGPDHGYFGDSLKYVLDELIRLRVVRTELHTIKLYSGLIHIDLLQKLFTVFPNLKHLHALSVGDAPLTLDCLKPLVQLQSLTYDKDCRWGPNTSSYVSYSMAILQLPMRFSSS